MTTRQQAQEALDAGEPIYECVYCGELDLDLFESGSFDVCDNPHCQTQAWLEWEADEQERP